MDDFKTENIVKELVLKLKEIPSKVEGLDFFDVKLDHIQKVERLLSEEGKIETNIIENIPGPVLVIFKERHSDNNTKREVFLAFQKTIDYYNFLGTEGGNSELIGTGLEQISVNTEKMVDFILSGNFNLSSEAIESYYGNKVNTFGVDLPSFIIKSLRVKAKELAYDIALAGLGENNPNLKKEEKRIAQEIFDNYLNTLIKGRNIIWLENIIHLLKNTNLKTGQNFLAITGGAEHAEDLGKQALNKGFKGYIIFTSNSLPQK